MTKQREKPVSVGAIFRSALAFGAKGIVVQDRHSPALAGALAKASAGAVKAIELSGMPNLLFRRNSVTGRVEATPRSGVGVTLNSVLHK
jgi:tRNA G18 (ribose-2'-O)-methylase SpoU